MTSDVCGSSAENGVQQEETGTRQMNRPRSPGETRGGHARKLGMRAAHGVYLRVPLSHLSLWSGTLCTLHLFVTPQLSPP